MNRFLMGRFIRLSPFLRHFPTALLLFDVYYSAVFVFYIALSMFSPIFHNFIRGSKLALNITTYTIAQLFATPVAYMLVFSLIHVYASAVLCLAEIQGSIKLCVWFAEA